MSEWVNEEKEEMLKPVQHDITYFRISPLRVILNLFQNLKRGDAETLIFIRADSVQHDKTKRRYNGYSCMCEKGA